MFAVPDDLLDKLDYTISYGDGQDIYPSLVTHSSADSQLELLDDEDSRDPAFALTRLMHSKAEDILNSLSADQLIQLGENVRRLKEPLDELSRKRSAFEDDSCHLVPFGKTKKIKSKQSRSLIGGMNLPASMPVTDVRNGVEHLIFTYSTKGHVQEYSIRVDIDTVSASDLPEEFRRENCVYPRACVSRDVYVGNRYEYETKVNDLAWRLAWINKHILNGKRGLIQRAVDSYRNRFQESRSRRVIRQDKIKNGTLRRRVVEPLPQEGREVEDKPSDVQTTIQYENRKGRFVTVRIRTDIDKVDLDSIDETFKVNNCLFPKAMLFSEGGEQIYPYECAMNEIGWKLAYLNPNKLAGKRMALVAATDLFREKYDQSGYECQYVEENYHFGQAPRYGYDHPDEYLDSPGYEPSLVYDYGCYSPKPHDMIEHDYVYGE